MYMRVLGAHDGKYPTIRQILPASWAWLAVGWMAGAGLTLEAGDAAEHPDKRKQINATQRIYSFMNPGLLFKYQSWFDYRPIPKAHKTWLIGICRRKGPRNSGNSPMGFPKNLKLFLAIGLNLL